MAVAYTLYDVLRTLVERVGWPTEEEKRVCLASISEAERMGIFGNLAKDMACQHEEVQADGKCAECGGIVSTGQSSSPSGRAIRTRPYEREGWR